jgi:membrane-bound lytic murein transglycosylase B
MKFLRNKYFKIIFIVAVLLFTTVRVFNYCAKSSEKETVAVQNIIAGSTISNNTIPSETKLAIANDNVFRTVVDSLIKKGVDTAFINKYIVKDNAKFDERFIKINVTGYLKPANYSYATSDIAIRKSKQFFRENSTVLNAAAKKYNIPKEIIVSILWIETRLGDYLGKNHIPSVFFSTALTNEPEYIELNNQVVRETDNSDSMKSVLLDRVKQRSDRKAKWAINELAAMSEIEKKFGIDFNTVYGSWAGAFGISQFLPSSFLNYAVDGNNDGKIDLFDKNDAIHSVANYLAKHKWGNTTEQKRKAIWSYNNSNAYVDAVLKLAELIKKP